MTEKFKQEHRAAARARKMFWNRWQEAFLAGRFQEVANMLRIVICGRKPNQVRKFTYGTV
jgi:hypothetical protein